MVRATELAHVLVRQTVQTGDWTVDATTGQGHDTALLAHLTGPSGLVFGFDIQSAALAATASRIQQHHHVTLLHAGHELMAELLPPDAKGRLTAIMFNLGYLPGSDKQIVTRTASTVAALACACDWIAAGGLITLGIYPGHPGGADETAAVIAFAAGLPATFAATHHTRLNSVGTAPALVSIRRLR
jgi:hypothetical protein